MAQTKGIVICAEVIRGKIDAVTRELLTTGRKLADELNQPLGALLLGKQVEEVARDGIALGADRVYVVNGPPFADAHPDLYVGIISGACRQLSPSIILLSHTEMGRDTAPRLAARINASVTMDCTRISVELETGILLQSKPVYGGNAIAVWASDPDTTQVVTMRPRATMAAEPDLSRTGDIIPLSISIDPSSVRGTLLKTVKEEAKGIKLEDAKAIVAGGGGIGNSDGFALLEELTSVLGGATGVSRVPCDEGWRPLSMEIGQTGHYVSPNLYLAIGISGAPQHMVGCSGSKLLVAINRDPDANIFKEADFGVVGDYRQVLPSLIARLRTLRG